MLPKKYYNVLDSKNIKHLAETILSCTDMHDESHDTEFYRNSSGITDLPVTLNYVDQMTDIIKKTHDVPFYFSNTYSRIYRNNSYLGIHTDRSELDISMSLCVSKTISDRWPLYVSLQSLTGPWNSNIDIRRFKDWFVGIDLDEGDAAVIEGTKYPHWRDTLTCDNDSHCVYVFFHWTIG